MGSPSNQTRTDTSYLGDRDTPDIRYDPPIYRQWKMLKGKEMEIKVCSENTQCVTKKNLKAVNVIPIG